MSGDEAKSLGEMMTQVRLDIRELMTEVRSLKDLGEKVEEIRDKTIKTEDSVSSAHKRLDSHDKIIFWAATTLIGAIIVGAITLLYKSKGG